MNKVLAVFILASSMISCKTTSSNLFSSLPSVSEQEEKEIFSFKNLNIPDPKDYSSLVKYRDEFYPRIFQTTYRASSHHQMPLGRMIRAMLGDPYTPIESKYTTALRYTMLGKSVPFEVSGESQRSIDEQTKKLKRAINVSEEEMTRYVQSIVFDKLKVASKEELRDRFIYYKSETYSDFSDDLIYTTTLPYIASFYGPRFVELNEWASPVNYSEPRSVDMNYLNYKKYGTWLEDGLPTNLSFYWEDSGQFITPMLTHSTVTGYQIRDNYKKIDRKVSNNWNIFEYINKKLIGEFRSVNSIFVNRLCIL